MIPGPIDHPGFQTMIRYRCPHCSAHNEAHELKPGGTSQRGTETIQEQRCARCGNVVRTDTPAAVAAMAALVPDADEVVVEEPEPELELEVDEG